MTDEFEKWLELQVKSSEKYMSAIEKESLREWSSKRAKKETLASLAHSQQVRAEILEEYRSLRAKQTAPMGLVEGLAALEHDQWMAWAMSISVTEVISQPRIDRWKKCMVPYHELTEDMKEFDRIWARKAAGILSRYQPAKVEEPIEKLAERKGWPLSYSVDASGILYSEKAARAFLEGLKDKGELK